MERLDSKNIFLIDCFGAILSSFMLGIVLVKFEHVFGLPKSMLYLLAVIPLGFAVYDIYCYFKVEAKLGLFLKGIAILNILYCLLSIGLSLFHRGSITVIGWAYILLEILIILILVKVELNIAKTLQKQ